MAKQEQKDPRVTKRRVTMKSAGFDAAGNPVIFEVNDYVRPDHLEAYLADANRLDANGFRVWQSVTVSDEPDAGPGGYEGATHVPAHLSLPDAGTTYAAEA